jgi:nitrate/TMAO reductase-like tetraheme cytochrome c subunit
VSHPEDADRRPLPPIVYNPVTLVGAALGSISLGLIVFLILLTYFSPEANPYMGIVAFVILPVFLIGGIALMAGGVWREVRLRRRGVVRGGLPRIDLDDPRQRRLLIAVGVGSIFFVAASAFGSFQAFEYTESNAFCGTICHTVMHPEYTAYQQSPHARVHCVDCHIGSGAEWFVRSKLSGAYQVYAVLSNRFPRPIPTPISNLRPARDTCETCHWPAFFYNDKLVVRDYYLSDEANTHERLRLAVHIGGGRPNAVAASGIHWHMNTENQVHYYASDDARQDIPWVKTRTRDGTEKIFRNTDSGITDEQVDPAKLRRMDCLDCHNRPTHDFHPAPERVNLLLSRGRIDPTLPNAKATAVEALEGGYASNDEAMQKIESHILDAYRQGHPEVARSRADAIGAMVSAVQEVYRENYFPTMGVSWRKFPDNIGHLYSPGCFRCHDGKHVSDDGSVISRDCTSCHELLRMETAGAAPPPLAPSEFHHPVDIGGAWREMSCSDCHGG